MPKRIVAVLALLILAFCAIPLPARHTTPKAFPPVHGEGALRAGAAQIEIQLGKRAVLAGYAGSHKARSQQSKIYARALVIEVGGAEVVLAELDTLLIPPGLMPAGCGILAASHTHSGPGGLWDDLAAGYAGAGPWDEEQHTQIVSALVRAQADAARSLQPAELVYAREDWPQGPARARSEGAIDPQLAVFRLQRPRGAPIATVISYSMHPTSAPREVLSADWPGAAASHFAEPTFVLQGAGGNATYDRALDTAALGRAVAIEAQVLLGKDPEPGPFKLACSEQPIDLPPPRAPRTVPWPLRRAYANLLALGFSTGAVQTKLEIGPLRLVSVPGEPVGELGLGSRPAILVSLSNGYAGYVETPEHWEIGSGESKRTYFGPDLMRTFNLTRP